MTPHPIRDRVPGPAGCLSRFLLGKWGKELNWRAIGVFLKGS